MIADEVEESLTLIRRLSDPAVWERGEAEVLAALPVLERLARMVAAASVAATAQLDRQGIALARGYASSAGLLMHALRVAPHEAAQRQRLASALTPEPQPSGALRPARLPATSVAIQSGDISLAHARVIDHTITELPAEIEPQMAADAEVFLAEQARQLNPRQLSALGAKLRARLDQDGLLRDERDAIEDRELFFARDHRGRVVFRGRLDTETGAALQTAIGALATPQPTQNGERDLRTPARRRADALADLANRALAQGDLPSSGGERPHVVVTINEIELRERIGSATLTGDTATEIISAGTARRIACDASILPMVLGSRSEPLDVGRASYVVPQPMRAPWSPAIKGVPSRVVIAHPDGATPTTSSIGPTAATQRSTTSCSSVDTTTASSTTTTGTCASPTDNPNSCRPRGSTRYDNPDAPHTAPTQATSFRPASEHCLGAAVEAGLRPSRFHRSRTASRRFLGDPPTSTSPLRRS